MFDGERLRRLLQGAGLSQSELARRVRVSQSVIAQLAAGNAYGSKHLHRIARELGTTPEYLTGEVDDPSVDAAPPPREPTHQLLTLQVALPSEAALTRMFEGLLAASPRLHGEALAHELAKRLPTALGRLRGPLRVEDAAPEQPAAADEAPAPARRAPRQASRT